MLKSALKILNRYKKLCFLIALTLVITLVVVIPTLSNTVSSSVWDGSVAASFKSGNGTSDDPYIISDGSEFAYLMNILKTDNSYYNLYYKITNNIDMNGYDLSNEDTYATFSGYIDGSGFTISNFTINNKKNNTEYNQQGIFSYLYGATIKNLNLSDITLNVSEEYVYGGVLASAAQNSTITNISLTSITVNKADGLTYATADGLLGYDLGGNTISNINLDISGNGYIYSCNNSSTLTNILVKDNGLSFIDGDISSSEIHYYKYNKAISFNDGYSVESMLEKLNQSSDYKWSANDGIFKLRFIEISDSINMNITLDEHESGVSDSTVYVNDYESDLNYYYGLNYTYSSTGTLPSLEDKNVYNSSNLIEVKMSYNGTDLNGNVGYVSIDERQNKYVYYKAYVVNNNGTDDTSDDYVSIELIDNPFSDHPTNAGFNGWVTKYDGASITLDTDTYVRYIKIPVTYTDGIPNKIDIDLYASWINANVGEMNGSWDSAFDELETAGMHEYSLKGKPIYSDVDLSGYYTSVSVRNGGSIAGYYDQWGNYQNYGQCRTYGGGPYGGYNSTCTYYASASGTTYSSSTTYYKLVNGQMTSVNNSTEFTVEIVGYEAIKITSGNPVGLYQYVKVFNGTSIDGYVDESGNPVSGTCNSTTCEYYKMVEFTDETGNESQFDENITYYYLNTRDTNIINLTSSTSTMWSSSNTKPFTLTSVFNSTDLRSSVYLDIRNTYINAYADMTIENVKLYTTTSKTSSEVTPTGSNGTRTIYGRYFNLKIGRGITENGTYVAANAVVGGTSGNQGSSSNLIKYTLRIESGIYNSIGAITGNSAGTVYTDAYTIFGNDYDRVTSNNTNFIVQHCLSGTWAGTIRSSSNTKVALKQVVKSGTIGANKYDYATGLYIGGRNTGTWYAPRQLTVEGGYIYNIVGGPLTASSQANYNDTYIYIKGGYADIVIGGAGRTETYGNRIIQVTGGTIGYSVFGGSNGVEGSNSSSYLGTLTGTPYVYIGGNAVIGDSVYVDADTIEENSQTEAGSVFGIGNGRSGYSSIGSADNSNIVITGNATVRRNVYGGGNYGATGISSDSSTNTTNIVVHDGTIVGAIYGGGNNNGAGSTSKTSTININVDGGTIGAIYGGSRTLGTVYGNVNLNVTGGTITDVYGGGEGGYESSSATGTFVTGNVNLTIGNDTEGPIINNNVYGGSAYGTVNATSTSDAANDNQVNVTINKGNIIGSVFGGAKGSESITPYVKGNITVTVNDGTLGYVYGGFDESGKPQGDVYVYLKGGIINTAFGGGNKTDIDTTNIYLQGSEVTTLFGGSNNNGAIETTNVSITSGKVESAYGGNNLGGSVVTTNITVDGGKIAKEIYGGGNEVFTTTTNLLLTSSSDVIPAAYGGGNNAGVTTVNVKNYTDVTNLFGGSNNLGDVDTATVDNYSGTVINVYGANNLGGTSKNTYVNIHDGKITNVYGGGNLIDAVKTNVLIEDGTITNVFGGGNEADTSENVVQITGGHVETTYGGGNLGESYKIRMTIDGGTLTTVYGGGNEGTTGEDYVTVNDGDIVTLYGGSNKADSLLSEVTIKNGTFTSVYGGGNEGTVNNTTVTVNGGTIDSIFGAGNNAGALTTNLSLIEGTINHVYGGSNKTGDVGDANVVTNADSSIYKYVPKVDENVKLSIEYEAKDATWETSDYKTVVIATITITNYTDKALTQYDGTINLKDSGIAYNYSHVKMNQMDSGDGFTFNQENIYYGINSVPANGGTYSFNLAFGTNQDKDSVEIDGSISYEGQVFTDGDAITMVDSNLKIGELFGGNNLGGTTSNATVMCYGGMITNLYGGGNQAAVGTSEVKVVSGGITNLYAGGNQANVNGNAKLDITGGTIINNAYGGGNEGIVTGNTYVTMNNGTVEGSLYAGGNGSSAVVKGNTNITLSGTAVVGKSSCTNKSECSVFGGGNAAATGLDTVDSSIALVKIAGGHVYGNVYGGANTSKVYGITELDIGADVETSDTVIKGDILIGGTVFGGGEANASGSENYDFSFISVTKGITVNINGLDYDNFEIDGSIFGSGNASSTSGTSIINIKNYGVYLTPKHNTSLQRADKVIIDNSSVVFSGATDRENDYSNVLFSISRIDELDLQNNSTLYLENNANLLKVFKSLDSEGNLATVTIDDDTVTKNVDNRLYMLTGEVLNVAKDQRLTEYGDVYGMTFLGMYNYKADGSVYVGMYDKYDQGQDIGWGGSFDGGTYVMGAHKTDHDITVDGFYSNFLNDENTLNTVNYIDPTPDDADYYYWSIGESIITYEIDLEASKYSTFAAKELPFPEFYQANTSFIVLNFDYSGLVDGINLVDESTIPRINDDEDAANTQMGLTMKSSNSGWLVNGETSYLSQETNNIIGTTTYVGENSTTTPSLLFYLYHSKNITKDGGMGTVTISIMAITKIDDLTSEATRIVIKVNLSRILYTTNDYEASITAGREYELFATTSTNITSKSSFSTYYSLYVSDDIVYKKGYKRALVSDYALPENTKITMIDLSGDTKKYYYYVVSSEDVKNANTSISKDGDCSYDLSKFQIMGAIDSGVYYDDATMNDQYYDASTGISSEEFIFIFDLEDTNITSDIVNKSMLFELQNDTGGTAISVLGIEASDMHYSVYVNEDATIDVDGTSNKEKIYGGESFSVESTFEFTQSKVGSNIVYDTDAFDSKLGVKLSLVNSKGEVVSGTSLLGLYYEIDGVKYYPNIDGTTRVKLVDKVGNYKTWINVYTENASIATGQYYLRMESYASKDGIYFGLSPSDTKDVPIYIINEIYGLNIYTDSSSMIIDGTTGNNQDGRNIVLYDIIYNSGLENPRIHVKLYRRSYDTVYDTDYELVDLQDYVSNALMGTSNEKEYLVNENPNEDATIAFTYKSNLLTGTYKLTYVLYDGDTEIGSIDKYFIVN